ncbi:hypothetical protein SBA4_4450002 [Candidatus Sulfopaludibacter sp. SbA4]|nr:hypothetical protein SBA4_4450002 [Candidatus Sulfopaludibacter sp. SbA4]
MTTMKTLLSVRNGTILAVAFDFTAFAQKIYSENPEAHKQEFLLPALYGGEIDHGDTSSKFKALVILIAPSVSFTADRWTTQCTTVEKAITRHREIFFDWAFSEPKQAELAQLFRGLISASACACAQDFFRRVYITDIWKDTANETKLKLNNPDCRRYGRYWRSQLENEIKSVPTERVIFVGKPARAAGWRHVPDGTPRHWLDFLTRWNEEAFKAQVQQLLSEIQKERKR